MESPSEGSENSNVLEAVEVSVSFDGLRAVDEVNLRLRRGEIAGLIGPNGAGKTVLVNVLSGFQRPSAGKVLLAGIDITNWSPERRVARGLSRTFQGVRPFRGLDVFSNVELAVLASGADRREAKRLTWNLLDRLGLSQMAARLAGTLPHGGQRLLGLARGLGSRPQFLLLDEPAAGLNEDESEELVATLRMIRGEYDLAMLVIEHDMRVIMSLCDRIQVLDHGRTIAEGAPSDIRTSPAVLEAYLGSGRILSA